MNPARRLERIIRFLAHPKYLIPAGLILAGLILLSVILGSFSRQRKKDCR
jgi:LPXTG-motif cell wall-anchored protein